jgi:hypothetical protein
MTRISIQATIKLPNEKKVGLRLAYISPQKCGRIMVWVCRCRTSVTIWFPGADPGFQVRGAHLKKLRRAEGGAKIFGVFHVKNHDFTPKNHMFFNCRVRRENFWGISCEKSRFYAKKSYFFPILGFCASVHINYHCVIVISIVKRVVSTPIWKDGKVNVSLWETGNKC